MNNNVTKVTVGGYSIELSEETLKRLYMLKECEYMSKELDGMINETVQMYNAGESVGTYVISAKDAMDRISLLRDAKKDYEFLCSMNVCKEEEPVFVEDGIEE